MKKFFFLLLVGLVGLAGIGTAFADDLSWPRRIDSREETIIVYQPQLESFENDILTARAAVSVEKATDTEPTFGAIWFEAQAETDREQRNVSLRNVKVLQSKFPDATGAQAKRYEQLFSSQASGWNLDMTLDQMLAMLNDSNRAGIEVSDLKNDPPKVYYRMHPALLVVIDGEPKLQPVKNSKVMRVVNSPMYIVFEPTLKAFYLKIGDEWFTSPKAQGNWRSVNQPPTSVLNAAAGVDFPPVPPEVQSSLEKKPEIVVSYEPAELIVSDGEPQYALIDNTGLLYMSNSDSDVFMEIDSQQYYVVLSGRWYRSRALSGPWQYVAAESLPAAFRKIPEGSPKEHVLAHIPDTVQANEAILDATIPQTERVERDRTIDVDYDGTPDFVPVSGIDLAYAVNTPYAVLRVDGNYYACSDAVWYISGSPYGPWRVAISVPSVIYSLPPSVPIYYVRYVYVYGYTPDIVYVGYTPGYLGTYVYDGVIVYGTGYHYRPWFRTRYYPRPLTWGFHVNYNTYYGWSFGVGLHGHYGNLWFSLGNGWWGPVRQSHHYYNDVNINYNRNVVIKHPGNIYRPISKDRWKQEWQSRERDRRDNRATTWGSKKTVERPAVENYRRTNRDQRIDRDQRTDRDRSGSKVEVRDRQENSSRVDTRERREIRTRVPGNDVYTDRKGNIYRRTDQGWEKREKRVWKPEQQVERKDNGKSKETNLNREYKIRERGVERDQKLYRSNQETIYQERRNQEDDLTRPDKKGRKSWN